MALCTGGMIERGAAMKTSTAGRPRRAASTPRRPARLPRRPRHERGPGLRARRADARAVPHRRVRGRVLRRRRGLERRARARAPRGCTRTPVRVAARRAARPVQREPGAYGDVYTRAFAAARRRVGQFRPPDGGAARRPPQRGGGRARARDDAAAAARPPPLPEGAAASSTGCCVFWANGKATGVPANCDAGTSAAADRDAGAQRERRALRAGVKGGRAAPRDPLFAHCLCCHSAQRAPSWPFPEFPDAHDGPPPSAAERQDD